jgi:hypothetical protein
MTMGMLWGLAETMAVDEQKFQATRPGNFGSVLDGIIQEAERAGMDLCLVQAKRARSALDNPEITGARFFVFLKDVGVRMSDYLQSRTALMVPQPQNPFYDAPTKGWEKVLDSFPAIIDHVEEASKCYALGRNTASVYHLMAIVQEALEALSKRLSVPLDPHADTWNGLLGRIDAAIKAKKVSMPKPKWKASEAFYAEIISDLIAIKNAWRNPTMHFRRSYTDEQAAKIYRRVQDFMVHASMQLKGRRALLSKR